MAFLSVIVLSYNQESMIEKCLNSLLDSQTNDVELVVSDDCSSDRTVSIIDNWILKNERYFESISFIKNKNNIGTVRNLINAVDKSTSNYIKDIAGDDWFLPKAIDNIKIFVSGNIFDVAFSAVRVAYENTEGILKIADQEMPASKIDRFFQMSIREQFVNMTSRNCLCSPGSIYTREFWKRINLKQDNIKLVEDWAMWLKGLSLMQKFVEMPYCIVVYRKTLKSVSNNYISPTYRTYLLDNAWVIKNISLVKYEWLSRKQILFLITLWLSVEILSKMPFFITKYIVKIREILCNKKFYISNSL